MMSSSLQVVSIVKDHSTQQVKPMQSNREEDFFFFDFDDATYWYCTGRNVDK